MCNVPNARESKVNTDKRRSTKPNKWCKYTRHAKWNHALQNVTRPPSPIQLTLKNAAASSSMACFLKGKPKAKPKGKQSKKGTGKAESVEGKREPKRQRGAKNKTETNVTKKSSAIRKGEASVCVPKETEDDEMDSDDSDLPPGGCRFDPEKSFFTHVFVP